jgi:hypothetical protein
MTGELLRDEKSGKFLKGNKSGGRKKSGYALTDMLKADSDKPDLLIPTMTRNERIVKTIVDKAIEGDYHCIEVYLNRMYGKEVERIAFETEEPLDLSKLTYEELVEYDKLLEKLENVNAEQD